jgi:hypothetical protein
VGRIFSGKGKGEKTKAVRLRHASKKRAPQLREYSQRRKIYLAHNPKCRVCSNRASEIHHSQGRIGSMLNNEEYWIQLCRECHHRAHMDRRWACANSLLPKPAWLMAEELRDQ